MLASKTPYAVPLGGPTTQTPVTAYTTTPSQRPTMNTKPQESVGFSSPTKSEFSDGQDELASVRCDPDIFGSRDARTMIVLTGLSTQGVG